jgi:hypothetical protein
MSGVLSSLILMTLTVLCQVIKSSSTLTFGISHRYKLLSPSRITRLSKSFYRGLWSFAELVAVSRSQGLEDMHLGRSKSGVANICGLGTRYPMIFQEFGY